MAIRALKRRADRAHVQEIENSDDAIFPSIVNEGSGTTGNLYGTGDTVTTDVNLGTGTAVTSVTVGTSGSTTTVEGNLTVNGTTTTINTENLTVEDKLILLNANAAVEPADSMGVALERGSSGDDAVMIYQTTNSRFELGFAQTSGGTVAPTRVAAFAPLGVESIFLNDATSGSSVFIDTSNATDAVNLTNNDLNIIAGGSLNMGNSTSTTDINLGSATFTGTIAIGNGSSGAVTVDSSAGISLDAATASNFTVSGATADLTLGARASTITLNEAGDESLNSLYAAASVDSIIGALNAIARGEIVDATVTLQNAYENGNTITTSSAEGDVTITGNQDFLVTLTGALNLGGSATGTITIGNASAGAMTLDSSAGVSIDAATASNFTVSGATADLTLGARGSTITLNEAGDESLNSLYGAASVDSIIGALNAIARGEIVDSTVTLQDAYVNGNTITTSSAEGIVTITGNQSLDVTADGGLNVGNSNILSITDSSLTNTSLVQASHDLEVEAGSAAGGSGGAGSTLTLQGGDGDGAGVGGDVVLDAGNGSTDGDISIGVNNADAIAIGSASAGAMTLDTAAGISLDAATASNFTVSGATADLTFGARASTITLNEAGDESLNSLYGAASVDSIIGALNAIARGEIVDSTVTLQDAYVNGNTITTSSAEGDVTIAGNQDFLVTLTGALNLGGSATGTITIGNASAGAMTLDSSAGVSIDAATASNFTVSGATADLTLGARATTITLNEAGDESLNSLYAAASVDSIIGAFNAIARGEIITTGDAPRIRTSYTAGEAISAGEAVYISTTDTVMLTDADAETTSNFIGIAQADIASSATGFIVTDGVVNGLLVSGLTIGTGTGEVGAGNPVFLSLTTGSMTTDVSSFTSGDTVYSVGYIKDALTYNASSDLTVEIQIRPVARTLLS